jgi:hypothetical protein
MKYRNNPTIFAWELIDEPHCMYDTFCWKKSAALNDISILLIYLFNSLIILFNIFNHLFLFFLLMLSQNLDLASGLTGGGMCMDWSLHGVLVYV